MPPSQPLRPEAHLRRPGKTLFWSWGLWVFCLLPLLASPTVEDIKAVIAIKALHFIEWPMDKLSQDEFVIGVVGSTDDLPNFKDIEGKNLKNRMIKVIYLKPTAPLESLAICDFLYFDQSLVLEKDQLQKLMFMGTFTAGQGKFFIDRGGLFQLAVFDEKISFDINKTQAEKAGFKIRSQLLRLARKVH